MPAKEEIATWALSYVRQGRIDAYDEVGARGDAVRLHYPQVVKGVYELYPMWWAERRTVLAKAAGGSDDPLWLYAYNEPGNCLDLIRLEPTEAIATAVPIEFMRRDNKIYAQANPVAAIWITGDVEPGRMSALFADGVAMLLAARLSFVFRTGERTPVELDALGWAAIDRAAAQSSRGDKIRPLEEPSSYERAFSGGDSDYDPQRNAAISATSGSGSS